MIEIREMKETDWDRIRAIYMQGLEGGKATFQTEFPTYEEWNQNHLENFRYIAVYG